LLATRTLSLVAVLSVLTLQTLAGARPRAALAAEDWQFGEYTEFKPVGMRGLAPAGPLKLSRTAVQRPRVSPGDSVDLIAEYDVSVPTGTMTVKETRFVYYNGQLLGRKERSIPVPNGSKGSTLALKVPANASLGWYSVKTTVEAAPAVATRSASPLAPADIDRTGFNVEKRMAAPPGPTPTGVKPPTQPTTPSPGVKPPIATGPAASEVKLWVDKTDYKVGDNLRVSFEASRDGYVTLVNVGTSGRITIIYPNGSEPENSVKGGRIYSVPAAGDPYELTLGGPAGVELLYAVFMTKPIRFTETNFAKSKFAVVNERAEEFTRDINVTLKTIPLKEQANAAVEINVTQ
jgi:Domain of unknown function (DUF4384)